MLQEEELKGAKEKLGTVEQAAEALAQDISRLEAEKAEVERELEYAETTREEDVKKLTEDLEAACHKVSKAEEDRAANELRSAARKAALDSGLAAADKASTAMESALAGHRTAEERFCIDAMTLQETLFERITQLEQEVSMCSASVHGGSADHRGMQL